MTFLKLKGRAIPIRKASRLRSNTHVEYTDSGPVNINIGVINKSESLMGLLHDPLA